MDRADDHTTISHYQEKTMAQFTPTPASWGLGLATTTIMQQLDRVTGIANGEGLEPKGSGDMTTSSTNDTRKQRPRGERDHRSLH